MPSMVLLAVCFLSLLSRLSTVSSQSCSTFGCDPTKALWGYFKDSNDFDDPNSNLMYQEYLFPTANTPILSANTMCRDACNEANVGELVYISDVWYFQQTCTQGGTCNCYSQPACSKYVSMSSTNQKYVNNVGSLCRVSTKGDPHFTGADNSHFDFSGVPNETFCMLSDAHLHINIFLGGRYGMYEGNPHKALTWIRKIALLWAHHTFVFEARTGPDSSYGSRGYMENILVDGEPLKLGQQGDKRTFFDGAAEVLWVSAKEKSGDDLVDVYDLKIADVIHFRMILRPEVASLRTEDDGVVHFSVEVLDVKVSDNVHGILGQTYRKDHAGRLEKQELVYSALLHENVVPGDNAEGFIDGSVEDYRVSDFMSVDCAFTRFARAPAVDEETAKAIETSLMAIGSAAGSSVSPRNAPVLASVESSFNTMATTSAL